jgi:hypothetical protein
MVAAFPVTTWSLKKGFQMEHKDMLHATYRLKIVICYRKKRHIPLRCPCELVILMKRPYNQSKLRWDLNSWPHICQAGKSLSASLKKRDLETIFRIWHFCHPCRLWRQGEHGQELGPGFQGKQA